MRLVDCETLEVKEFIEGYTPPYIALSHTWGSDEVTLQELINENHQLLAHRKPGGFQKIKNCCEEAMQNYGISYCWIDTCSIDKTSSTELSEAINSMFGWYKRAKCCFVYLSDVHEDSSVPGYYPTYEQSNQQSRWWTRGWTLQELIAPSEVYFFSADWKLIGSKEEGIIKISKITGITTDALKSRYNLSRISIAERMSWASQRKTTRAEDIAYSLMGIFDINMPLLYGEGGAKAFIRLQEEIMKVSYDQSILAWIDPRNENSELYDPSEPLRLNGVLAVHPKYFAKSASFRPLLPGSIGNPNTLETSFTNVGLKMQLRLVKGKDHLYAILGVISSDTFEVGGIDSEGSTVELTGSSERGLYVLVLAPEPYGRGSFARLEFGRHRFIHQNCLVNPNFRTMYLSRYISDSIHVTQGTIDVNDISLGNSRFRACSCLYSVPPVSDLTVFEAHFEPGDGLILLLEFEDASRRGGGRFSVLLESKPTALHPSEPQPSGSGSDIQSWSSSPPHSWIDDPPQTWSYTVIDEWLPERTRNDKLAQFLTELRPVGDIYNSMRARKWTSLELHVSVSRRRRLYISVTVLLHSQRIFKTPVEGSG